MLNIGRGRRKEHPKDTSEGVTWPSVTFGSHVTTVLHFVLLLSKRRGKKPGMRRTYFRSGPNGRILHNFRLRIRTPKGTPKGSDDLWSHPVAMLLLYYYFKKKRGGKIGHAQNILSVRTSSGHVTLSLPVKRHCTTSCCACAEHTSEQGTWLTNRNYSAILATLQITSYVHSRNSS